MSYQVLARKWRPKRFQEMVGQEHVLKALVNALDDDRLHHAYLFTGTRGVGKTSIARLFAKSLNCETGVSSSPCGECSACREIAEGRFVDLIEVDAASRTKVEDTRELLENVQYAPTHGRYKVYLIDEVHMLSTHSFNALLKTLEEPPPHVKFLLATTDPQKLPVTILSRCLQFNLKNMIPERIVDHLKFVLGEESVHYEEPALWLLARSADGSMRDAMSLTDQAIAFGAGEVNEADVRAMLGTIDTRLVYRMVECLVDQDAQGLLDAVNDLAQFSPDYNTVLGDLISLLHRIAVGQALPSAVDNSMGDKEQVQNLASRMRAEDLQLFYQIALMGRKDLPFVPDAREGLEMILLRMLAFRPAGTAPAGRPANAGDAAQAAPSSAPAPTQQPGPAVSAPAEPQTAPVAVPVQEAANSAPQPTPQPEPEPQAQQPAAPAPQPASEPKPMPSAAPEPAPQAMHAAPQPPAHTMDDVPPWEDADIPADDYDNGYQDLPPAQGSQPGKKPEAVPSAAPYAAADPVVAAPAPLSETPAQDGAQQLPTDAAIFEPLKHNLQLAQDGGDLPLQADGLQVDHWVRLASMIGLTGMTASLANNLSLEAVNGNSLTFHYTVEQKALLNDVQQERIVTALNNYFAASLDVEFRQDSQSRETPSLYMLRKKRERLALAVESIQSDETVKRLQEHFDAEIDLASVEPID
ncbi:DNA polymerase III subunit gamma/tau [Pontibacterium granulatum]|uniref:DNA polymerase III subunit gamma/tau n=1 Tax=Pontibacterium granulatum TaxID=2036029 RepID=UPI00249A6F10|nr:DNA polymerase III subunit gamma/tau [Pontibacterium granulatum]MDI3324480.1 DNA polymerase III subunit gamma/tau [Pontibacterium granulatum]